MILLSQAAAAAREFGSKAVLRTFSVLLLSACASEPSVVTKVEIEYPTVSDSWFQTQPFPDYPPRPVTLTGMVEVFEKGRGLYAVCQANLREVRDLIRPPVEEPPCTEEGKADCR